jgi:hypothetical protein
MFPQYIQEFREHILGVGQSFVYGGAHSIGAA